MINPQNLLDRLDKCIAALGRGNTQMKTLGLEKARTRKEYSVRLQQEYLKLRAEGEKVTIISELAKGNDEVAELRLKKDIAESSYYVGLEAMNNLRLEIEIIRSQLTWLRAEFKNS